MTKPKKTNYSLEPSTSIDFYLTSENIQYCKLCKYKGIFSQNYLCSFNAITGRIRGCKPGVGCTRRILEKSTLVKNTETKSKPITRTCAMCGKSYQGTKRSQYCTTCRRIASSKHRRKEGI